MVAVKHGSEVHTYRITKQTFVIAKFSYRDYIILQEHYSWVMQ